MGDIMIKKISFKKIFILCIVIITFYKIVVLCDTLPSIIMYGNIIYSILESILYVINQLAIGISGAIVFYYLNLFFELKKNMDVYTEIRAKMLYKFYYHLEILKNIKYFKELHKSYFMYKDCDRLCNIMKNSLKVKGRYVFDEECESDIDYIIDYEYEEAICEYLLQIDVKELTNKIDGLNSYIKEFNNYILSMGNSLSLLYHLKEVKDKIENLTDDNIINDDLFQYNEMLKEHDEIDIITCKKYVILCYLQLLSYDRDFYVYIDNFIKILQKNNIIKFIKIVD